MPRVAEKDVQKQFYLDESNERLIAPVEIKAIITNLDGVITGERRGFNFPNPHEEELASLRMLQDKGIPVSICTAKFNYPVQRIIRLANLVGPHITDAGAVIIDPLGQGVVREHVINEDLVRDVLTSLSQANSYVELYTTHDYYIEGGQNDQLVKKRIALLEKSPIVVESLAREAQGKKVIKVEPIVTERRPIENLLSPYHDGIELSWTSNPTMPQYHEGIITQKGVSKKNAVLELAQYLNLPLSKILGIGYSSGHWDFMQECGYVGVIGNNPELQEFASAKGEGKYTVGRSVDEHGFLDILNYFGVNLTQN